MAKELQPINPNPPRPSTTTPRMYTGDGSIKGATFVPSTGLFDPDTVRGNSVEFTAESKTSFNPSDPNNNPFRPSNSVFEPDPWLDQFNQLWYDYFNERDPADDFDDFDRIEREQEANRLVDLIEAYDAGTIGYEQFMAEFNTGDIFNEIPGFDDWIKETRDAVQYDSMLNDWAIVSKSDDPQAIQDFVSLYNRTGIQGNRLVQADLASTGSATAVITGTIDNSILEDMIRKAAIGDGILGGEVDFEDLPGYGGIWEGLIRHIKIIGKGLPLPIPDWLPLPGIFELPTVGEIFDTVTGPWKTAAEDALRDCVATGKSASQCMEEQSVLDILVDGIGNATEGVWEATKDKVNEIFGEEGIIDRCTENPSGCAQEVFDKIKDIFGEGAVDPTSTGGNIPDWLKVIIIGGAYGDEILGELEDLFGGDINGDELVGTPEDPTVTPPVTPEFDCASVGREQVAGATTAEECGPLIAPYGYCEDGTTIKTDDLGTNCEEYAPNGFCEDGVTKKDNPEGTNCNEYEPPLSAEEQQCNEQGRVFNDITEECEETCANPEHVVGADGNCGPPEADPEPCANNATTESGCERCSDGSLPSEHENGDCSQPKIVTETSKQGDPCKTEDGLDGTLQPVQSLGFGPSAQELECVPNQQTSDSEGGEDGPPCDQPQPGGFEGVAWAYKCQDTHCPADGSLISDHPNNDCSIPIGTEVPSPEPEEDSPECDQQYRVTNPDGSCGECKPGFTPDPEGFDQCIQAPPECNDCSCAEYAAANPVECTECPEGESYCEATGQCETAENCPSGDDGGDDGGASIGGGVGGVGGGANLFEPYSFAVSADPTLLGSKQFPITDFLAGVFTNSTGGKA